MKLIGLSLSGCIRMIGEDKVPIGAVHHIVTGCSPRNQEEVDDQVVAHYLKGPWRFNPARCLSIFSELYESDRIMWVTDWHKTPVCGCQLWVPYPELVGDFTLINGLFKLAVREYTKEKT